MKYFSSYFYVLLSGIIRIKAKGAKNQIPHSFLRSALPLFILMSFILQNPFTDSFFFNIVCLILLSSQPCVEYIMSVFILLF